MTKDLTDAIKENLNGQRAGMPSILDGICYYAICHQGDDGAICNLKPVKGEECIYCRLSEITVECIQPNKKYTPKK